MSGQGRAAILGLAGPALSADEEAFFADADPWGFILFARNVQDPDQVRALVESLRDCVGRDDAPVLIDQEGGRVQRLKPPHWRQAPPAAAFGALAAIDRQAAREATFLNHRLIAADLAALGITVDCAPVLDVLSDRTHDIIGDRAFGRDPDLVADLGRCACDGLLAGGVLPVLKHIPGHGRARADSHLELPRVVAGRGGLEAVDCRPFRRLQDMPLAMTAHIVYEAIDAENCATLSRRVIDELLRGDCGFDGAVMSDDLSMKALDGDFTARARRALAAGCDLVLHCNGDRAEMEAVMRAVEDLDGDAARRCEMALDGIPRPFEMDLAAAQARLDQLLAQSAVA